MGSNPLLADSELPAFSKIDAAHIEPAVTQTLEQNRAAIEALLTATPEVAFETVIVPLEELSDRLAKVWGPVSHLHGVANSPEIRAAYNNCLPALARYQTELAQDERLFNLYERVGQQCDQDSSSKGRLVKLALRDFRLAGVNLPANEKQRYKALIEELTQLGAQFEQNVLDAMAAWSYLETVAKNLAGLPASVLERAAAEAGSANQTGWLFKLDQPTYIAVVTHAEDRDLRHRFYRAWVTRASDQADGSDEFDNTKIIQQVLKLRHEAARLVGFENYAEYSLAAKMADSVTEVQAFLEDLALKSKPAAERELEELERFAGQALAAWDIAYWSEKLRADRFCVSDEELRPYFPLDTVLSGMFGVVNKLYGVEVRARDNIDTWHADVNYYEISDTKGDTIGGFYTDLFARENKRSGAWMDECVCRKQTGETLVRPVAYLVCNFAAPTESAPCLLTHDDVLTLFHEFGHTLHHLLTQVAYPSVSGINGVPWDAVELPSQFMENFVWQPEVLNMISGHYRTGEHLPENLQEKLQSSRVFQSGLQMLRQIEFALFDLRLHAEYQPQIGGDVNALLESVRRSVAVIRQPAFNRFANGFSHIFAGGYAAGYYSYKWAEVLAADAWSAFVENGIFDAQTASRFRSEILEIGGTRDIGEAFAAFRGRSPSIEPLLVQAGIALESAA